MLRLICISLIVVIAHRAALSAVDTDPLAQIRSLTSQQQYAQALELLDVFLAENPQDMDAKLLRGVIFTRQGNIDGAIEAFEQLSSAHPSLPEPHNNLAVLHASRGDYEAARLSLLRAIEMQPSYDTAHENLGDLYATLATTEYEKALKLNPENNRAEEKTRVLNDLLDHNDINGETPRAPSETDVEKPQSLPNEQTEDTGSPKSCFLIGRLLQEGQAKRVFNWFSERQYVTRFTSREESVPIGFRVFIPPLESAAAADVQVTRMRSEGIKDIIRISTGEYKNGIALGVYATEAAALRRVDDLGTRGYMSEIAMRSRRAPVWYVAVALPLEDLSMQIFSQHNPDYPIREVSCN